MFRAWPSGRRSQERLLLGWLGNVSVFPWINWRRRLLWGSCGLLHYIFIYTVSSTSLGFMWGALQTKVIIDIFILMQRPVRGNGWSFMVFLWIASMCIINNAQHNVPQCIRFVIFNSAWTSLVESYLHIIFNLRWETGPYSLPQVGHKCSNQCVFMPPVLFWLLVTKMFCTMLCFNGWNIFFLTF